MDQDARCTLQQFCVAGRIRSVFGKSDIDSKDIPVHSWASGASQKENIPRGIQVVFRGVWHRVRCPICVFGLVCLFFVRRHFGAWLLCSALCRGFALLHPCLSSVAPSGLPGNCVSKPRRGGRLQAGGGAKRNPCLHKSKKIKPRRGDGQ